MAQNYFQELADQRIDGQIDFSNITTKEEYIQAVKDFLNTPSSGNHPNRGQNLSDARWKLEEIYENSSKAKSMIEATRVKRVREQEDAFRKAQRIERSRGLRERLRDESRTAKNSKTATLQTVRQWRRNMGRMDIKGVDTRLATARKNRRARLLSGTAKHDLALIKRNIGIHHRTDGTPVYRDINTGRFASPKRKRR